MNNKYLKYWLKKSLYYPGITLCAGIALELYFTLLFHDESSLSSGSFLMDFAGLLLILGGTYITILSLAAFDVRLNSSISYGATRRQSVSILFSSTAAGAVILLLIFILLCFIGSPGKTSLKLLFMGINLYLLSMIIGFPGGYLIMKHGKIAYYIVSFSFLFATIFIGIIFTTNYKDVPGFDWTCMSSTLCGSPLISLVLAALLAVALIFVRRGTEKMEVKL